MNNTKIRNIKRRIKQLKDYFRYYPYRNIISEETKRKNNEKIKELEEQLKIEISMFEKVR